jgi:hypothetical protein
MKKARKYSFSRSIETTNTKRSDGPDELEKKSQKYSQKMAQNIAQNKAQNKAQSIFVKIRYFCNFT